MFDHTNFNAISAIFGSFTEEKKNLIEHSSRRDFLSMLGAGAATTLLPRLGWALNPKKRPLNILFLVCDQYRPDALSRYGDPYAITPSLDSLAAAGVSFRQTYCQAPICMASRNCIMTGRYAHSTGVITNGYLSNPNQISYAQLLRSKGYKTACFGKLHTPGRIKQDWDIYVPGNSNPPKEKIAPGDILLPMMFHTDGKLPLGAPYPFPETETEEWHAVQNTIKFLDGNGDRPWLVQCSLLRPHPPLQPPKRYWEMIDRAKLQIPSRNYPKDDLADANPRYWENMERRGLTHLTDDQVRDAMQGYYGNIAFADHLLGMVLRQLDHSGLRENTLVVFTADHGEMLDDHRLWTKMVFFDPSVRVPLILHLPDVISGGRNSKALVEQIDLFPTMMGLLGFETPSSVQGKSFLKLAKGETGHHRDVVYSEFPNEPMYTKSGIYNPTRMQFNGRYKVVDNGQDIDPEIYDLQEDPLEIINLCHHPAQQDRLKRMLNELRAWGKQHDVPIQPQIPKTASDK